MRSAILVLLVVLVAGCAQPTNEPPADVVASFYPVAFLAREIAGPHLVVATLIPPGIEPHDYEPTPRDVKRAHDAKLLIVQGAGFEEWLHTVVDDAPGLRVVDVNPDLHPDEEAEGEAEGDAHDAGEEAHDEHEGPDPHTWLDVEMYANASRIVEAALIDAFPEHADDFRARGQALRDELARIDAEYREGLEECASRVFITTHAAFGRLADRYDLTMVSLSGIDPDAEPTSDAIREAIDAAREHNATTIYYEEFVSPRVAQAVAREVGATMRILSPIEGVPADRPDATYVTLMRENLVALREGLRCT